MGRLQYAIFADGVYASDIEYSPYLVKSINKVLKDNSDNISFSLSVDASTTCTGFALVRDDLNLHFMCDYAREDEDKESFFQDLKFILSNLVWGLDISNVVIEQPILQTKTRHTKSVLLNLCKILKTHMREEVPELYGKDIINIRPNSWKSWVFNKDKYKGGYNNKRVLATCLCEKFPIYTPHLSKCISSDMDCFDAMSMLRYYIGSKYNSSGARINFASTNYTHYSFVCVKCLPSDYDVESDFKYFTTKSVVTKEWNEDYNYFTNIKMASTVDDIVIMKIKQDYLKVYFAIEAGVTLEPNKDLYVRIMRQSHIQSNKSLLENIEYLGYKHFVVY